MKLIWITAVLFAFTGSAFAEEVSVLNTTSKVSWEGSKVIGSKHHGTLKVKDGSIVFEKQVPTSAVVVVDMTSIVNTDLTDPKWNAKLVGHLKSDDFFSVKKFPESKLDIKTFEKITAEKYRLKGELTIKGITKPVELTATTVKKDGAVVTINSELVFDRTDFSIKYGSGKFFQNLGDKMISDMVKVNVSLNLKKPVKLSSK
ncbi:MAG: YceI family protein [Bdellovibrionota bacterium]